MKPAPTFPAYLPRPQPLLVVADEPTITLVRDTDVTAVYSAAERARLGVPRSEPESGLHLTPRPAQVRAPSVHDFTNTRLFSPELLAQTPTIDIPCTFADESIARSASPAPRQRRHWLFRPFGIAAIFAAFACGALAHEIVPSADAFGSLLLGR